MCSKKGRDQICVEHPWSADRLEAGRRADLLGAGMIPDLPEAGGGYQICPRQGGYQICPKQGDTTSARRREEPGLFEAGGWRPDRRKRDVTKICSEQGGDLLEIGCDQICLRQGRGQICLRRGRDQICLREGRDQICLRQGRDRI